MSAGGTGHRLAVAVVGPDPSGRGGMASVLSALLASDLVARFELVPIVSHDSSQPLRRLATFARSLVLVARFCLEPGPRLLHVHTTVRGSMVRKATFVLLARALRRPVLLHVHAGPAEIQQEPGGSSWRWRYVRAAIRKASLVIAVSRATADALENVIGLTGVRVVPNAAPPPVQPQAEADRGDTPPRVLYLGGFANPVKGGAVLAEAIGRLPVGAARLLLAGPGDAPQRLLQRTDVRWLGWLDAATRDRALAEADILVLPSLSEGLPVALLEGLANGLTIVATPVGGVPEVVDDGVDALVVEPGDADALAQALLTAVRDGALRQRLGRAGRERANRLNAREVVDRLDGIYRGLASALSPVGRRSPLRNRSGSVAFLAYHALADDGPSYLSLSPDLFQRQLRILRKRGFVGGGVRELRHLLAGRSLPQKTVFLTFDDAYRDTYDVARPMLEAEGYRALVFVLPPAVARGGPLDWREVREAQRRWPATMRSMDWSQVQEMASAGHEFGAHSLSHPHLPDLDDDELVTELRESGGEVRERLGKCHLVAYPFGEWNSRVAFEAALAGFEFGFSLPFGAQSLVTPLSIPRLSIDHRDGRIRFAFKLTALGRLVFLSPVKPLARRMLGRTTKHQPRYALPNNGPEDG